MPAIAAVAPDHFLMVWNASLNQKKDMVPNTAKPISEAIKDFGLMLPTTPNVKKANRNSQPKEVRTFVVAGFIDLETAFLWGMATFYPET
jgi:hypothetical protein